MSSSLWAHPRAGGENSSVRGPEGAAAGSSPRGRGKLGLGPAHAGRIRLIPARAGKTRADHGRCYRARAHPRAGGENEAGDEKGATFEGSSPRGRGKHPRRHPKPLRSRLIPARAGKTSVFLRWRPHHWAHPRAGGENPVTLFRLSAYSGSSPRGRGKPELLGDRTAAPGLIPARAGKTSRARVWCWGSRDHPRAGGENWAARRATCPSLGSSPRGRGKQRPSDEIGRGVGLIPARAGKT